MKPANKLLGICESLEQIDESITLTWKGKTPKNESWFKAVSKKYPDLIGKFKKEFEVKTNNGPVWVLMFEGATFAGVTEGEGKGSVKWWSPVGSEDGMKKAKAELATGGGLFIGKHKLNSIPDSVKKMSQLVELPEFQKAKSSPANDPTEQNALVWLHRALFGSDLNTAREFAAATDINKVKKSNPNLAAYLKLKEKKQDPINHRIRIDWRSRSSTVEGIDGLEEVLKDVMKDS